MTDSAAKPFTTLAGGNGAGVVIVGAGHAGGRCALALRKKGYISPISLLGAEAEPPYERPPLSKAVLAKGSDPLDARLTGPDALADAGIRWLGGRAVTALDLAGRRVTLADGAVVPYASLVLATGARPRVLSVPGVDLAGVMTLRSAADARALRSRLTGGARVVLVGGGFIGLEVAASARALGCAVTVVESGPALLGRVLPAPLAAVVARLHQAQGVTLLTDARLEAFAPDTASGALSAVHLADGRRLDADVAVLGVGAEPNTELAMAAGLACHNGIVVDSRCRTAMPGVYAIGDVANHLNTRLDRRLRLESWDNAERQADLVAGIIAGTAPADAVNDALPWFWTDQFDLNLQILGMADDWDRCIERGVPGKGPAVAVFLKQSVPVMAVLFNAGRERRPLKALIDAGLPVDPARLADTGTPLRQLSHAA